MQYNKVVQLMVLLQLVCSHTAYHIQYSSGTIIKQVAIANVGHTKTALMIKIPKIWTIPEPECIQPSVLVHQFLTNLAYSNITYTSRLLTHFNNVCADYTRIKHLNKGVRRYSNERIHTAEDTISVLYRNKYLLVLF